MNARGGRNVNYFRDVATVVCTAARRRRRVGTNRRSWSIGLRFALHLVRRVRGLTPGTGKLADDRRILRQSVRMARRSRGGSCPGEANTACLSRPTDTSFSHSRASRVKGTRLRATIKRPPKRLAIKRENLIVEVAVSSDARSARLGFPSRNPPPVPPVAEGSQRFPPPLRAPVGSPLCHYGFGFNSS